MGYYIQAYSIDSAKIKALWNSKDNELYHQLTNDLREKFQEHDEWFDLDDDNDSSVILEDIINGVINHPKQAYLYGYVYENLCEKFGQHLHLQEDEIHLSYLEEVSTEYSAFIPIPFSNDFPHILSIANVDLKDRKMEFLDTEIDGYSEEDQQLYTTHFRAIFDHVIAQKLDFVFFNY